MGEIFDDLFPYSETLKVFSQGLVVLSLGIASMLHLLTAKVRGLLLRKKRPFPQRKYCL